MCPNDLNGTQSGKLVGVGLEVDDERIRSCRDHVSGLGIHVFAQLGSMAELLEHGLVHLQHVGIVIDDQHGWHGILTEHTLCRAKWLATIRMPARREGVDGCRSTIRASRWSTTTQSFLS